MRLLTRLLATALLSGALLSTGRAQLEEFDPFAAAASSSSKLEFLSEVKTAAPGKPFHVAIKLSHPRQGAVNSGFGPESLGLTPV